MIRLFLLSQWVKRRIMVLIWLFRKRLLKMKQTTISTNQIINPNTWKELDKWASSVSSHKWSWTLHNLQSRASNPKVKKIKTKDKRASLTSFLIRLMQMKYLQSKTCKRPQRIMSILPTLCKYPTKFNLQLTWEKAPKWRKICTNRCHKA